MNRNSRSGQRAVVFALLSLAIIICASVMLLVSDKQGIVVLPGYEHAVALCGNEIKGKQAFDIEGEAHLRLWDGNTFTINWGHENDQEVKDLRRLAKKTCAQYNTEN